MSGTFEDICVPPTLVSFAVTMAKTKDILSPEFKSAGSKVYLFKPCYNENNLPITDSLIKLFNKVSNLNKEGKIKACYTPTYGGVAEAIYKMAIGNGFGFKYENSLSLEEIFGYNYGAFIVETDEELDGILLGYVTEKQELVYNDKVLSFELLNKDYEDRLESVYPLNAKQEKKEIPNISFEATNRYTTNFKVAKPKVIIPAFPGTNCEFDSAKAMELAGAEAKIIVVKNLNQKLLGDSIKEFTEELKNAQMIFIPGGFSGGDEPDGSGKFITAFFRNAEVKEGVSELLDNRDGLMCGICNGFQALIKLGLVPFGKIIDTDENCPTLSFNTIARHQSKIVRTRIASNMSPWLSGMNVGDIVSVPISHGEGKFMANDKVIAELIKNGQVATQYVDLNGNATSDIQFNPNDSVMAIEGITSPDGRVFGKMGHSERVGNGLYKNVLGDYDIKMFKSAVKYFK